MKKNLKFRAADIAECAIFIVLMVAATYIQIPFPLVPLTFQTVISVLAGLLLGWKKGVISMSVYCFMGLVGLPVFTAGGGFSYVLKPSFGYIVGFIASAFVGGLILGNGEQSLRRYIAASLCAFISDYAVGIPYCIVAAKLLGVENLTELLIIGNLVYMPKDAVLSVLAAFLAKSVVPAIRRKAGIKR
ncbi:MAG: biotin transporter BioY [Clostridia bacterium]|nr:biotin transporter BioY [Clostridia bacterium]